MSSHYSSGREDSLIVPFITDRSGLIYVSPIFGLKIDKVLVDGREIAPVVAAGDVGERLYSRATVRNEYIYLSRGRDLIAVNEVNERGAIIVKYSLDMAASRIEVWYRIRYGDNSLGAASKTISLREDHIK